MRIAETKWSVSGMSMVKKELYVHGQSQLVQLFVHYVLIWIMSLFKKVKNEFG